MPVFKGHEPSGCHRSLLGPEITIMNKIAGDTPSLRRNFGTLFSIKFHVLNSLLAKFLKGRKLF